MSNFESTVSKLMEAQRQAAKLKSSIKKNPSDKIAAINLRSIQQVATQLEEEIQDLSNSWNIDLFKYSLENNNCLLYTSPSPRDATLSRMPSSA